MLVETSLEDRKVTLLFLSIFFYFSITYLETSCTLLTKTSWALDEGKHILISLLKVVIRGHEVLKHHQLQSKRTILSSRPMESLIIYAKPGLPYYLYKALISRRLAIGGKASLKSTAYPFLQVYHKNTVGYYFQKYLPSFGWCSLLCMKKNGLLK